MTFRISDEVTNIGKSVYLAGGAGIGIRSFGIAFSKVSVGGIELVGWQSSDLTAALGLFVVLQLARFSTKTALEFTEYQIANADGAEQAVSAESVALSGVPTRPHVDLEHLAVAAEVGRTRAIRLFEWLSPGVTILDVGFPILFGLLSLCFLARPIGHLLKQL